MTINPTIVTENLSALNNTLASVNDTLTRSKLEQDAVLDSMNDMKEFPSFSLLKVGFEQAIADIAKRDADLSRIQIELADNIHHISELMAELERVTSQAKLVSDQAQASMLKRKLDAKMPEPVEQVSAHNPLDSKDPKDAEFTEVGSHRTPGAEPSEQSDIDRALTQDSVKPRISVQPDSESAFANIDAHIARRF